MGKIDVALKHTIAAHPRDWAAFLGVERDVPVEVVDSDVSALANVADKVFVVQGDRPFVLHIEPQAWYDETLDDRMHAYAALLRRRHRMTVHTVVVALDRSAVGSVNRARLHERSPLGRCSLDFRYELMRVWTLPAEELMDCGPGILPLVPIAKAPKRDTAQLVRRMAERFDRELPQADAADLWTATYVLVGLKYDRAFAQALLRGVREIMKQSSTYQEILEEGLEKGREEGRSEGKQDVLIRLGRKRFHQEPGASTLAAIRGIHDLERLDAMAERLLDATGWDDLLAAR